jgi:hypothetical protein
MGDVQQEEKIMTAGLETSVPIRGDAMERHHPWWHGRRAAGRKDNDCRSGDQRSDKRGCHGTPPSLVASADVRQEEKIKTAGLETSVPLEEEPAGFQRS